VVVVQLTDVFASGTPTRDYLTKLFILGHKYAICCLARQQKNELVSTHGYSENAVVVWKYPSMKKLATLTGHSMRVLYLAMSPQGDNIVTGAGDETLRFWKIFPEKKKVNKTTSSLKVNGKVA